MMKTRRRFKNSFVLILLQYIMSLFFAEGLRRDRGNDGASKKEHSKTQVAVASATICC